MAVHIRLARMGTNKTPFYRIVVADQRSPRGGKFIERLGTFDPRRSELRVEGARVLHWLQRGAKPSATVTILLKNAKIIGSGATPEGRRRSSIRRSRPALPSRPPPRRSELRGSMPRPPIPATSTTIRCARSSRRSET